MTGSWSSLIYWKVSDVIVPNWYFTMSLMRKSSLTGGQSHACVER